MRKEAIMSSILISIIGGKPLDEELKRIYKDFEKHEFTIEVFYDLDSQFNINSLTMIMEFLKEQERYKNGIDRVVVLSNIKELLLTWYRLYNYIVDDYILLLDFAEINNDIEQTEKMVIKKLASFSNIHNDKLSGQIYLNITTNNYKQIIEFLIAQENYQYFNALRDFNFFNKKEKKLINKTYTVDNYKIEANNEFDYKKVYIDLNNPSKNNTTLNRDYIKKSANYPWFLFFLSYSIIKSDLQEDSKRHILYLLFDTSLSEDSKNKISGYVELMIIDNAKVGFIEKIIYLSLLVKLKYNHFLLQKIFDLLKKDYEYIEYHYPILTNTLFYISNDNLTIYPGLFKDRMEVMEKVKNYYKQVVPISSNGTSRDRKKIAIVTGQLLSLNHAPTQWAINYANTLKMYFPDYEIKIFVDDIFKYSPNEVFWPHAYSSASSCDLANEHNMHLEHSINVHYSNSNIGRVERIKQDIIAIIEYNPTVIFKMGSPYSLPVDLLYDYYPVVSMSMGGAEDSKFVDVFTGGYSLETFHDLYSTQEIYGKTYIQHTVGIQDPISVVKKNKHDYGFKHDDFIMITVGNRLNAEVTEEFTNIVCSFLQDSPNTKWLIIGTNTLEVIEKKYKQLILEKKIIFIPYEQHLFDLYNICDVYVNPFRKTGGNSGALAMKAKLPIVTLKGEYDVSRFVGEENCVEKENFNQELINLCSNQKYWSEKSNQMYKRIQDNYSFENTGKELMDIFKKAITKFKARIKLDN